MIMIMIIIVIIIIIIIIVVVVVVILFIIFFVMRFSPALNSFLCHISAASLLLLLKIYHYLMQGMLLSNTDSNGTASGLGYSMQSVLFLI